MQRVLITGSNGMLGVDVGLALQAAQIEPIRTARQGADLVLDVTDRSSVRSAIESTRPLAVIHCAAYTLVDRAESEPDAAFRVNAIGSRNVAAACAEFDVPLCAVSTDFVFNGRKQGSYTEFDPVEPLSVYGASKLAGEAAVRETWNKHWIVRTSWLYGSHGKCFPDTILKAAETRPKLTVVADQFGTPTYTVDLAAALVRLIQYPVHGTYHAANSADNGPTSWYDFAREALAMSGSATQIQPILTGDWPTPAVRPANSALRCYRFELEGLPLLRPWREALASYLEERRTLSTG